MARHNAYLLMTDINTRLGYEKAPADDADTINIKALTILRKGEQNISADMQLKVIRELHIHFPFLKTMLFAFKRPKGKVEDRELQKMEYAPADYYEFFAVFLKSLNELRNEYSHAAPQKTDFPGSLLYGMRLTFDAAVRKARERFSYTDKDVDHLIRLGKGGKERAAFNYKFQDEKDASLSLYGFSFFICLLLERKYITLFTQKLYGLKNRSVRKYQASYEVFAIYGISLPRARYTSDVGEGALLLDMLNELKKCPSLLFPQLPAKYQDTFRIPITEIEEGEEQQEGDSGYVLVKRHEDRFTYFALRFIDEVKWFSSLHFPIDLGNYHYYLYNKTVEGIPRVASLWEKVIGYGRFPDYQRDFFAEAVPQNWRVLWKNHEQLAADESNLLPFMPRTTPHYHLPDDNISIKIAKDGELWPHLEFKGNDKSLNKQKAKEQPDLQISKYDLFSLVFYGLLVGSDRVRSLIENKLINYVSMRRKLYRQVQSGAFTPIQFPADIPAPTHKGIKDPLYDKRKALLNTKLASSGYDFPPDDLTDEIKAYLMGVKTESFEEKAKYRILDLLDETDNLLNAIKRKLKEKRKPGSKKDVEIKAGILADFLARDILMFQAAIKDGTAKAEGKATSTIYKVLQAKLALYGANADTIRQTFAACNLIGGRNPHPFLARVVDQNKKRITDFYVAYLDARMRYLEQCEQDKKYREYEWLKHNQSRRRNQPDYGRELAGRMLEIPIVIPRAFFTPLIMAELTISGNEQLKALIQNGRTHNSSFLVLSYLTQQLGDGTQHFYDWERVYKIFDNWFDERKKKRDPLPQKPLDERARQELFKDVYKWAIEQTKETQTDYRKRFEEFEWTEKQLRHVKIQDVVTFLMCDYLLKNINRNLFQSEGRFFLKDIGEGGILDTTMKNFGRTVRYSCQSIPSDTEYIISGETRIYQDNLKVKNVGDFNKFIKDRRLNNLLAFLKKEQIARADLEKELERYDMLRPDIFHSIHEFEIKILAKWPDTNGLSFEEILQRCIKENALTKEDAAKIKTIRNAFSHNQYPDPLAFMSGNVMNEEAAGSSHVADYFYNYLVAALQKVKSETPSTVG